MPPIVVIAAELLVVACPLLALAGEPRRKVGALALLPLVSLALLVAFVFGEDSYRDDGTSRWDAYRSPGGALEPLFFATVALTIVITGSMIVAVVQRRRRLLRASALGAAAVAVFLGIPTVVGFSAN